MHRFYGRTVSKCSGIYTSVIPKQAMIRSILNYSVPMVVFSVSTTAATVSLAKPSAPSGFVNSTEGLAFLNAAELTALRIVTDREYNVYRTLIREILHEQY